MNRMTRPSDVRDLLEHRLEAFLELAAVLCARDQRAHVQRDDALFLQAFRHVASEDAAGEAFDDGCFPDARLADQDGIVFVRRDSTWMTRRISSSRPITGSSLPLAGELVRSRP